MEKQMSNELMHNSRYVARGQMFTIWPTREDLQRSKDQQLCYSFTKRKALLVIANISVRLDEVINQNGGYIEHVLS
ncbi:hypothetical protein C0J52_24586 [Blattella germanica]|nr:hypothetical protein C0J52_24586 [Blattella germanica]